MNSHDDNTESDAAADGDDVTLAAGGDVVAQIRAHAAKVRSGEIADDEGIKVWQGDDTVVPEPRSVPEPKVLDEPLIMPEPKVLDEPVIMPEPGKLLPDDETVALPPTGASLIQGMAPPPGTTSFWDTDQPFRASGIDAPPSRMGRGNGIPLAAWIALVVVLIVVASVGIAVAVAAMGPLA